MNSYLFYGATIGFAAGAFVQSLQEFPEEFLVLILLISFTLSVLWRRRERNVHVFLVSSVLLFGVGLGMFRVDVTTWGVSPFAPYEGQDVELVGLVVREPDVRATTQHLYIKEQSTKELLLVTTDRFKNVSYGDTIFAEGEIVEPASFETDIGRMFDYKGYLRASGVEYAMFFADVDVIESGGGNTFIRNLLTWKHAFMRSLEGVTPEPQAGLGEGLLLGAKRALGEDLEGVFRETGIIHIVVLSGYNVMIVADAMMRFLAFVFGRRVRLMLGIAAISTFALLVGLTATVVRASIMAVLVLIARATGRTYAIMRALMLAGIVMLLFNPYLLVFDPGFQLSFLATLGLIVLAPHIEKLLGFAPTTFQIREFITATIATQIMVLPLLLYLIGQFSVVAVPVNVLVLPAVPFAMLFTFLTGTAAAIVPTVGTAISFVSFLLLSYVVWVPSFFALLPFASFVVPAFPFWVAVLAYGLIGITVIWLSRRRKNVFSVQKDDGLKAWTIETLDEVEKKMKISGGAQGASPDIFPFR